jgi:hypothetical protein
MVYMANDTAVASWNAEAHKKRITAPTLHSAGSLMKAIKYMKHEARSMNTFWLLSLSPTHAAMQVIFRSR